MYATERILSSDNSIISSIIQAYNKYHIARYIMKDRQNFGMVLLHTKCDREVPCDQL